MGIETRGRAQDEDGGGSEGETRAVVVEMGTGTGTKTGSGRAEERLRSARNRTRRVVDAMWETGESWVEREENADKKGLVQ